jgi:hypothetical protein
LALEAETVGCRGGAGLIEYGLVAGAPAAARQAIQILRVVRVTVTVLNYDSVADAAVKRWVGEVGNAAVRKTSRPFQNLMVAMNG